MSDLINPINPFAPEKKEADKSAIRNFVKNVQEITEKLKEAKENLNECIAGVDEVAKLNDQMKELKEERKKVIDEHTVIQGYVQELEEVIEEKKQLLADAKRDGIPKAEIDLAIKALKKDIDISSSVDIYKAIADLIEC